MVHALQEAWRVLRPSGMLLDLRPIVSHPPVDVLGADGSARAGHLDDSCDAVDQDACEAALHEALARGWFLQSASDHFTYSMYWEDPQAMLEYLATNWEGVEVPEDVVVQAQRLADVAVPPVEVRIQLTMIIAAYVKLVG